MFRVRKFNESLVVCMLWRVCIPGWPSKGTVDCLTAVTRCRYSNCNDLWRGQRCGLQTLPKHSPLIGATVTENNSLSKQRRGAVQKRNVSQGCPCPLLCSITGVLFLKEGELITVQRELEKGSQRGFMGTIAYDYSRSIAGDLPKRIVELCPLGRAWWLALPKAICQSCFLQLCSPKINSPNYIILNNLYLNSIEFPKMNYKHFREKTQSFTYFYYCRLWAEYRL